MKSIIGKLLCKNYKIIDLLIESDFFVVYSAIDILGESYFIQRLKPFKYLEDHLKLEYDNYRNFFINSAKFMKKFNFSNISQFVEIIENPLECIIVLKLFKANYVNNFLEKIPDLNYRDSFYFIKEILITTDIASDNKIFFDYKNLVYDETKLKINTPLFFNLPIKNIYIILAKLYYKILTKEDFSEQKDYIMEKNIIIPIETKKIIIETINQKIEFSSIGDFSNKLRDSIDFGTLPKNNEIIYKNKKTNILVLFVSITFLFIFIFLFSLAFYKIGVAINNKLKEIEFFSQEKNDNEMDYKDKNDYYQSEENLYVYDTKEYVFSENNKKYFLNYYGILSDYYYYETDMNKEGLIINCYNPDLKNYYTYKIDSDTGEKQTVNNEEEMYFLKQVGNNIYYSNINKGFGLFRTKMYFEESAIEIYSKKVSYILTNKNETSIYFISYDDNNKYKVFETDLNGDNLKAYISLDEEPEKFFKYVQYYELLKQNSVEYLNKINLSFLPGIFNIRENEFSYYFVDYDRICKVDKKDTSKYFDMGLASYQFEIYGDLIYFTDLYGYLKSYDLITSKIVLIYKDIWRIFFANNDICIVFYEKYNTKTGKYINEDYNIVVIKKDKITGKYFISEKIGYY